MADTNDWNRRVIEEFRANGGKVGGQFEGAPMLLLTTTGAKSGQRRTTPVMYLPDGNRLIIFASKAGAPTNPDWYHNLVAHPQATVEVGTETFDITAVVATGEERDRLFARQAELYPGFANYQARITRQIPVIALERREG
jgi:deazaflavin-dependent oxidoreductase (nitroreductase family)